MPVNTVHPEYNEVVDKWELVRAIANNCAQKYIRTVDPKDPVRSKQYRNDAILTNFTRLTQIGLSGLVFRKPAEVELPDAISYIEDEATGMGLNLEQLAQKTVSEVLATGRYGLLVDMSGDMAYIKPYSAEAIINWRCDCYENKKMLSLVVLKEQIDVIEDDIFDPRCADQYRVLVLNNGIYTQIVFDENLQEIERIVPTDYNGNPFSEIPFVFVGSENNDECIDSIPLYDLAVLNLGHYRNSADLEENIFITGQPFLVVNVGETSVEDFKAANPNGLNFGSRGGLIISSGGQAMLLQANSNQMVSVEMKRKEEQAAAIGARLISPAGGRETAEAARIRYGAQNSALYVITKNISLAIELCLYYISMFMMEVPEDSSYELNDQFYEDNADPNLIAQQIMLFDRGMLSAEEIRDSLKLTGVLSMDSDAVPENEIDPMMGTED